MAKSSDSLIKFVNLLRFGFALVIFCYIIACFGYSIVVICKIIWEIEILLTVLAISAHIITSLAILLSLLACIISSNRERRGFRENKKSKS